MLIERAAATFDDESESPQTRASLWSACWSCASGLERLINDTVRLAGRAGGALAGRKLYTLVYTLMVGDTHLAHADVLRAGATTEVLQRLIFGNVTGRRALGPVCGSLYEPVVTMRG